MFLSRVSSEWVLPPPQLLTIATSDCAKSMVSIFTRKKETCCCSFEPILTQPVNIGVGVNHRRGRNHMLTTNEWDTTDDSKMARSTRKNENVFGTGNISSRRWGWAAGIVYTSAPFSPNTNFHKRSRPVLCALTFAEVSRRKEYESGLHEYCVCSC